MVSRNIFVAAALVAMAASVGTASARTGDRSYGGVPNLDIKSSCTDAQRFSTGMSDRDVAYKGCMQDEMNAKNELARRWGQFKAKDKQDCVEQSRAPSPSYVEVLTCLEMDSDSMRNAPAGKPGPGIGGPSAPGLPASTVPNAGPVPRT